MHGLQTVREVTSHLAAEDVVHDAGPVLIVLEPRQQRAHARAVVPGVHRPDLLVAELGHGGEQLRQVAAHVGVRAVPDRGLGHLRSGAEGVGWGGVGWGGGRAWGVGVRRATRGPAG